VITKRELALLRAEWILDQRVIEKDYVLGWLLAGIAQHEELRQTWVFKGSGRSLWAVEISVGLPRFPGQPPTPSNGGVSSVPSSGLMARALAGRRKLTYPPISGESHRTPGQRGEGDGEGG